MTQMIQIISATKNRFIIIILLFLVQSNNKLKMKNQIQQTLQSILTQPVQQEISRLAQEKLLILAQKHPEKKILFELLQQKLNKAKQVFVRIKVLCILQNLINNEFQESNLQLLTPIIAAHQKRVIKRCEIKDSKDIESYFQSQVQLPYVIFLRKMTYWQNHEEEENTFDVSEGYSLLNKLKETFQLKKIFHNYSCYYSSHRYAFNMFHETLLTIRRLWKNICYMAQSIVSQIFAANTVLQQQFLFLSAAEEIQQTLVQFISVGQFSKTVGKADRIKKIQFLKPQIQRVQLERKKKLSDNKIAEFINSNRSGRKAEKVKSKMTRDSQNIEDKLSTEIEAQIIDSILRLQSLINQ